MRLEITLSPNTATVRFDYQHLLVGVFHDRLDKNELHDGISLYSLSWLQGAHRLRENGLEFFNGATFFVSAHNAEVIERMRQGIEQNPLFPFGMKAVDYRVIETPTFGSRKRFVVASPVLARCRDGELYNHLRHDSPNVGEVLTRTMETKLKKAGLEYSISLAFDRSYRKPKTKVVQIKGIQQKAIVCPVIAEGDPEAIGFAWDVGIGELTGCGFGAVA